MSNETIKLPDDIRKKCREPFPQEALGTVGGKSYLTSIKAMYVIERLNDIFGVCGWSFLHEMVERAPDYVTVKGQICLKEYNLCTPEQYGGHKTTGTGTEIADGFKSAVTDAITKCASYLEIGIDVFKGSVPPSGGASKPQQQDDGKPWLTEEKKNAMIEAIGKGQAAVVQEKMQGYKMKKLFREELNAALQS